MKIQKAKEMGDCQAFPHSGSRMIPSCLGRDRQDGYTLALASCSWQTQALLLFGQTPPHSRVHYNGVQLPVGVQRSDHVGFNT